MEAFFYYSELMGQLYGVQGDNPLETTEPESTNLSWFTRLGGWLSKGYHWWTDPIKAEEEKAYREGRLPTYWMGY